MFSKTIIIGLAIVATVGVSAQRTPIIQRGAQKAPRESRERMPWSEAAGRPQINFGRAVGIYIWHDGNRVHILSADDKKNGQVIRGGITLRGPGARVFDVDKVKDEGGDHVTKNGDHIRFRLDTFTGEDGFKFSIQGGHFLVFDIDQKGLGDRNVYVGASQIVANKGIVAFDLSK
jgi:hypothetical protein